MTPCSVIEIHEPFGGIYASNFRVEEGNDAVSIASLAYTSTPKRRWTTSAELDGATY
jgi:hypothetical protein